MRLRAGINIRVGGLRGELCLQLMNRIWPDGVMLVLQGLAARPRALPAGDDQDSRDVLARCRKVVEGGAHAISLTPEAKATLDRLDRQMDGAEDLEAFLRFRNAG